MDYADAVAIGVRVGEGTGLQDEVGGGFNTRRYVDRSKGDLLDFGKVLL